MRRPARDREPEPSGERRQSERQHEAIVETISEEEEEAGGRQRDRDPIARRARGNGSPDMRVQCTRRGCRGKARSRRSDSVRAFPRGRTTPARGKSSTRNRRREWPRGWSGRATSPSCCDQVLTVQPSPANERQHAGIEQNIQLKKKGEGFSTAEARQMRVLLRRYRALLFPVALSGRGWSRSLRSPDTDSASAPGTTHRTLQPCARRDDHVGTDATGERRNVGTDAFVRPASAASVAFPNDESIISRS